MGWLLSNTVSRNEPIYCTLLAYCKEKVISLSDYHALSGFYSQPNEHIKGAKTLLLLILQALGRGGLLYFKINIGKRTTLLGSKQSSIQISIIMHSIIEPLLILT